MAGSSEQTPKDRKAQARAEALRANLRRRKAVERDRAEDPDATALNYRPAPVGTIKPID
jgi:hypothetical protein